MIRAAVIGLGAISGTHLAALEQVPQGELAAVCDCREELRSSHPNVPFYTSYRALLEREKPDCVHICLPHHLHYPVARAAAEAGCHVFCEKPLARNGEEARQFAALEKEYPGLRFGLCFQNRKNPSFQALAALIREGKAGEVQALSATVLWARSHDYYRESPWRGAMETAGGGVMINQAIHTLDLMQLLGGPVQQINGSTASLTGYGVEVEDTASAKIRFSNGVTGYFHATVAHHRDASVTLEVQTEAGLYQISEGALFHTGPDGHREELVRDEPPQVGKAYYGSSHLRLIQEFYYCLETGSESPVAAADGVASLEIIDAIHESALSGAPVFFSRECI